MHTAATIALEVHLCSKRRSIAVRFATADQAVAYIERRSHECAFAPLDDSDLPVEVWAALDPPCEHGLSLSNCFGPNHYDPRF